MNTLFVRTTIGLVELLPGPVQKARAMSDEALCEVLNRFRAPDPAIYAVATQERPGIRYDSTTKTFYAAP